jgi:hypothetical protein
VFESQHPYPHNADVRHQISFPGAEKLEITFDERCRTEAGCDYVQFVDPAAGMAMVGRPCSGRNSDMNWPGANCSPALIHRGSCLEARFRSDGSINDWGYLFTVTAFYPAKSSVDAESFPHISAILQKAIESIVFDLLFVNSVLCLPKCFPLHPNDRKCISRCLASQACLRRLQSGMIVSTEMIMSALFRASDEKSSFQDVLPLNAALSVVSPNYFKVDSNSSNSCANSLVHKSHAFKVGDKVRLVQLPAPLALSSATTKTGAAAAIASDRSDSHAPNTKVMKCTDNSTSSGRQSKNTGTVIQVKSTRCVVKGIFGSKPYTFKNDQVELVSMSHSIVPQSDTRTAVVTAATPSSEILLRELQYTILARIWLEVSAQKGLGMSCEERCSFDRKLLCDVAHRFEPGSVMFDVSMSVSIPLLFVRLFSEFSLSVDLQSKDEWCDSASTNLMNSLRISLRSLIPFLPRVLELLPEDVFPRAVAALLFFVIRGNSDGASSASIYCFQLSSSILNLLQDQIKSVWPVAIHILYSKVIALDHDPLDDLALISACKEFDVFSNDKYCRTFESDHPYCRGCSTQHEITFPGICQCFFFEYSSSD